MPASTAGSVFQPLPPATALSQQWDVNCMRCGGWDLWAAWLTAAACLRVRVINSQGGGQFEALGVFRLNNGESNFQLSNGLRRFLPEYYLHILDSFIYFGRLQLPHYDLLILIYIPFFNCLPSCPRALRLHGSATVEIYTNIHLILNSGWGRARSLERQVGGAPSRSPGSVVIGGCGGGMMSGCNTLWSSAEAPHARMKHTRAKPVQKHVP